MEAILDPRSLPSKGVSLSIFASDRSPAVNAAAMVWAPLITMLLGDVDSWISFLFSNNLLFKAVELKVIEEEKKLEEAQDEAEKNRKELFSNYIADGKKNWEKNKSHFKGSYISEDMVICSKLTEDN